MVKFIVERKEKGEIVKLMLSEIENNKDEIERIYKGVLEKVKKRM